MNSKYNNIIKIKKFYYEHTENSCRVFCIMCNKIAYSTKENKYLNNKKCIGHNNLQCLNSSCANGFSKTYSNNYVVDKSSIQKPSSVTYFQNYMDRNILEN